MDESGMVMDLLYSAEGMTDVEWYEGALCPGFVNTHCHLELSHLKNQIPAGTEPPDHRRSFQPHEGA